MSPKGSDTCDELAEAAADTPKPPGTGVGEAQEREQQEHS